MSASSITGALPQLRLRHQTHFHFGCVLTRPAPWRRQVSLHKGANPCTSSPGACALIERAVVQRHTRSEAAVWRCPQQRATTGPDTERIQAGGPSRARSPRNQQIKTKTKTKRPGAKWRPGLKSARGKVYTTLLRPGRGVGMKLSMDVRQAIAQAQCVRIRPLTERQIGQCALHGVLAMCPVGLPTDSVCTHAATHGQHGQCGGGIGVGAEHGDLVWVMVVRVKCCVVSSSSMGEI